MSIFKETIDKTIANQLKAREAVLSQTGERDNTFLRFAAGKNAWVRMTSGVNADFNCKRIKDKDGKAELDKNGRPKKKCAYKNEELARKYILEGGTLYNRGNDRFSLRGGVNTEDGIYGSDLDYNSSARNRVSRDFGIRPMPGITSIQVNNKSAYGSLREATIQFYCWDKHQLEELEVLFMRTGYTVLLEWGWSQYIDHDKAEHNQTPKINGIKNFSTSTIDFFSQTDEDEIYKSIDTLIDKTLGNYDAMLGYIKNFSWQLMPNGGFQCTTVLISRGEVLENLKASSTGNVILGSVLPEQTEGQPPEAPLFSLFERIFFNLQTVINDSELSRQGEFSVTDRSQLGNIRQIIKATYADTKAALLEGRNEGDPVPFKYKFYDNDGKIKEGKGWKLDAPYPGLLRPVKGDLEGTAIEYIRMDNFIAILNRFFIPRNKDNGGKSTGDPLLYIVIPGSTPCLMSEDTVSIDPSTCLIENVYATFITDTEGQTGSNLGFSPVMYDGYVLDETKSSITLTSPVEGGLRGFPHPLNETIPEGTYDDGTKFKRISLGQIGNIYISIRKIIQIYRQLSSPDGVDIASLLSSILDSISYALGGINDFKLVTSKNIVQIIDAKYLEVGSTSKDKVELNLVGLQSIFRNVNMNSRIFAEQSSMIGIAAAAQGGDYDTPNLGDIYSSTQFALNEGLIDRIKNNNDISYAGSQASPTVTVLNSSSLNKEVVYYYNIYNSIISLSQYIKRKVLGIPPDPRNQIYFTLVPKEEEITNAAALLKTFHYQINGKDVDFKALIPFELECTLDGIGGLVIGQIFRVNKDILPIMYQQKNVGFVITGITQNLQNNDWTTTIKTQICLLDNDGIAPAVNKTKLKELIGKIKKQATINSWLPIAMADYMMYLTKESACSVGKLAEINEDTKDSSERLYLSPITFDFDKLYVGDIKKPELTFKSYIEKIWLPAAKNLGFKDLPESVDRIGVQTSLDDSKVLAEFKYDAFDNTFIYEEEEIKKFLEESKPKPSPSAPPANQASTSTSDKRKFEMTREDIYKFRTQSRDNLGGADDPVVRQQQRTAEVAKKVVKELVLSRYTFIGKTFGNVSTTKLKENFTISLKPQYVVYSLANDGGVKYRNMLMLDQKKMWLEYFSRAKKWLEEKGVLAFFDRTEDFQSTNFDLTAGNILQGDVLYLCGSIGISNTQIRKISDINGIKDSKVYTPSNIVRYDNGRFMKFEPKDKTLKTGYVKEIGRGNSIKEASKQTQ